MLGSRWMRENEREKEGEKEEKGKRGIYFKNG